MPSEHDSRRATSRCSCLADDGEGAPHGPGGPWGPSRSPQRRADRFSDSGLDLRRKIDHDDRNPDSSMTRRPIPRHQPEATEALQDHVLDALAEVRGLGPEELREEIGGAELGAAEVDSKEAEVVISMLHVRLDFDLSEVKVEDLEPEKLATVDALVALISEVIAA